jgi:hypothetical protein
MLFCLSGTPISRTAPQSPWRGLGIQAELEIERCNFCGNVYTAATPAEAGEKKYDETAVSMMAVT